MKTIEYNNQKFKLGSVVTLKNETTKMTVEYILNNSTESPIIKCVWMTEENEVHRKEFYVCDLVLLRF